MLVHIPNNNIIIAFIHPLYTIYLVDVMEYSFHLVE